MKRGRLCGLDGRSNLSVESGAHNHHRWPSNSWNKMGGWSCLHLTELIFLHEETSVSTSRHIHVGSLRSSLHNHFVTGRAHTHLSKRWRSSSLYLLRHIHVMLSVFILLLIRFMKSEQGLIKLSGDFLLHIQFSISKIN